MSFRAIDTLRTIIISAVISIIIAVVMVAQEARYNNETAKANAQHNASTSLATQ